MFLLESFLQNLNLSDSNKILKKFNCYYELLSEYNQKFNLTAITQKEDAEKKHFIDSLQGYNYIKGRVLDVGAGAGFPSIPLAIVLKENDFLLADSLNKRIGFLNVVIGELGLTNAKAVHTRIEDLKKEDKYDCAVARAVAPLNILFEYCAPFVKKGGIIIAYKGKDCAEEIENSKNAQGVLGLKIIERKEYSLGLEEEKGRQLIIAEKIKDSPPQYPRSGNKPRNNPL